MYDTIIDWNHDKTCKILLSDSIPLPIHSRVLDAWRDVREEGMDKQTGFIGRHCHRPGGEMP